MLLAHLRPVAAAVEQISDHALMTERCKAAAMTTEPSKIGHLEAAALHH
jgi:hypothetical protein